MDGWMDSQQAMDEEEERNPLEVACKGKPVKVFEIPKKGKGLFASKPLSCGDVVFEETPYAAMQAVESKADVVACGGCHKSLGPPGSALCLQAGACTRAQVTQYTAAPKLPYVAQGGALSSQEDWGVECSLGCGELFCSVECQAGALTKGGHARLCVGPLDSDSHPLYRFKMHALQTSNEFLLAAQIITSIIYQCEEHPCETHPQLTPLQRGAHAMSEWEAVFGGAAGGRSWWEVCAVPPEEAHVADTYRLLLQEQCKTAWSLLVAGLSSPPCTPALTPLPQIPQELLSFQFWGHLLATLEVCCQRLGAPSALVGYFRNLVDAPEETREVVLKLARPLVKKIEMRLEEEDGEEESDEEEDDEEDDEDEDEDEEEEEEEDEEQGEGSTDTSAADTLESLVLKGPSLFSGTEIVGLYPLISALNHSCHPNCRIDLQPDVSGGGGGLCAVLKVVRTHLAAGTELTISYIEGDGPRADRHQALAPYAFKCECSRCMFEKRMSELEMLSVQERDEKVMREVRALGSLAVKEERFKDASVAFEWVLGHNPLDGDAIHELGVVRLNEERWAEAHNIWRQGGRDVPSHPALAAHQAKQAAYFSGHGRTETAKLFDPKADFQPFIVPPTNMSTPHPQEELRVYMNRAPIFTPAECAAVIEEAEGTAAASVTGEGGDNGGWTTSRHYTVPTTDLPLHSLPRSLKWFNSALQTSLGPMLAALYPSKVKSADWVRVHDAFVVKYDAQAQRGLPLHSDQSEYSMTIALNAGSEYEGGGTFFEEMQVTVRPDVGNVATFPGFLFHQGSDITSGYRYIIAVFYYIDSS